MIGIDLDGLKGLYANVGDGAFNAISSSKAINIYYNDKRIDGGMLDGSGEAVASMRKCENEQEAKRDPFRR